MKANIHFFDVKHGDAIVVEYIVMDSSHWIVIDCNHVKRNDKSINPTLEFLRLNKVKKIDAVIITHLP
ncbi:Uncharacterised protein [Legionella busanensis]|uniref:MBL fold metallo-hydrolase n=1 Tax=Legionella busanensis TaxID=190655 RepID=A0A378KAS5_9GAMM|nr:Uncharacterised protein [Legionella busanensis]